MAAAVAATLTVTASVFSSLVLLVARFAKAESKESVFHAQLSLALRHCLKTQILEVGNCVGVSADGFWFSLSP